MTESQVKKDLIATIALLDPRAHDAVLSRIAYYAIVVVFNDAQAKDMLEAIKRNHSDELPPTLRDPTKLGWKDANP